MLEKCRARKVTNQQTDKIETVANKQKKRVNREEENERKKRVDLIMDEIKVYGARCSVIFMTNSLLLSAKLMSFQHFTFHIARFTVFLFDFCSMLLAEPVLLLLLLFFLSLLLLISLTSAIVSTIHGNVSYSQNFFFDGMELYFNDHLVLNTANRLPYHTHKQYVSTQNTVEI